jgi:hypothetical protein
MRPLTSTAFVTAALAFTVQTAALPASALAAPAQFQQQGTLRPAGGDRAVQQLTNRIRTDADALRRALNDNRSRQDRYRRSPQDDVQYAIDDVVTAADHLADHSARGEIVQLDLDDVLRRGAALETELLNASPSQTVKDAWSTLQRDLDATARAFGQTWNWRNPTYAPTSSGAAYYDRLSGTYELDPARSDNPRRSYRQSGSRGGYRDVADRFNPPQVISIERRGNEITLASSDAPRTTFDASGRLISESRGARNATTRAAVYGDRLEITTNGAGNDDFVATFEPVDGGRSLRLTRQLYTDNSTQPIIVRSMYRRTSEQPDWNVFNNRRYANDRTGQGGGGFLEDGTILTARLDAPLNLRNVRENDRVALTVHDAPQTRLENAVLEGYVSAVPSNSSDRFSIVFNRIRMSNGRTLDFDGTVESLRGPNGEPISFDGERVDNDDQRDDAVKRGAIGAAVGAIIGAIAGGSKGAAIGAVVGGGGGAASVLIGGQRQSELPRGTEFTIRTRGSSDFGQ